MDFHIAYYLGELISKEPDGYYHIISKDTGFDPLIEHLKTKKIKIIRSETIKDIPSIKMKHIQTLPQSVNFVLEHLKTRKNSKPATVRTLKNTIKALFQSNIELKVIEDIIKELAGRKKIIINGEKVTYHF